MKVCLVLVFNLCIAISASAQKAEPNPVEDLRALVETPAVPGYEQQVAAKIVERVKSISPQLKVITDQQSNVTVTLGSGSPNRLIAAPMDEPGYVVSGITPEGYLRLQRLPQGGNLPLFNELYAAQPVKIGTSKGVWINGAVAGVSVHLQPQRQHPPSPADLDNMFVDVGATSPAEARAGGADVLSPLAIDRKLYALGGGQLTAPAIGDRFGDAALLEILRHTDPAKIKGSVTFAFVAQQWLGARGLQRLVYRLKPDELIFVGRLMRAPAPPQAAGTRSSADREAAPGFKEPIGSGVLMAAEKPEAEAAGLAADLKQIASQANIPIKSDFSAPLFPRGGYMFQPALPARTVQLSIATQWPSTPAEIVDLHDVSALVNLLQNYLSGSSQKIDLPEPKPLAEPVHAHVQSAPSVESTIQQLIETYGVSGGHEANMRQTVTNLLPAWAKPETDNAGNLVLHWAAPAGSKGPKIAVVAHMDEIGYEVHSILPDGRLELESKGGGVLAYFLGHAGFVHSANGIHPGAVELPEGWDKQDLQWPRGPRTMFHMNIGAHTPEQAAQMGVRQGDFVTIPKQYRKLMGNRASARAFDDRVGCAALVAATWALGEKLGRDVTFIWSTSEELGLEGAAAAAKNMAASGRTPDYVFAIDTFVSSDSPLESPRFGDALLGKGFVVCAIDNSNVVPHNLVEKVISMARTANIPAQYGITGGGNDGAASLVYGATDVALGWPLRYSHSPAEVIDLRDLDALGKIIAAIARNW
jgi:putative aminopeptidase FrvX